jgi:hypothetical protein
LFLVIKTEPEAKIAFIDERLFETPSIAISECSSKLMNPKTSCGGLVLIMEKY